MVTQVCDSAGLEVMRQHIRPRRLWDRVNKLESGCWEWSLSRTKAGYGQITFYRDGVQYHARTHRLAWALENGPIERGAHILHECDNPACCNPAHLRSGTHQENIADAVSRNRMARGERSTSAKLTDDLVSAARVLVRGGAVASQLAEALGVSKHCLHMAVHGGTWSHLPDPVDAREPKEITDASVAREVGLTRERVRQLRARGTTVEQIRAGTYKRTGGRPRGGGCPVLVAWELVDWTLPDSEIARMHSCSRQTVTHKRRRMAVENSVGVAS